MKLVFVHGWGFDARFWEGFEGERLEFGYLGAKPHLTLPEGPYLAVGHSAGAQWLLTRDLPGCVGVVVINGFARFLRDADHPHGQSPRVLRRMRDGLAADPARILGSFRAGIGAQAPNGVPSKELLAGGLGRLADDDGGPRVAQWGDRLGWIAGSADPLVSLDHQRADFGVDRPHLVLPGGHLTPLEHRAACQGFVREMMEKCA